MRLQTAIAAREQTRATRPPPGSRAGVPADLIWPADRIGPQLHIGSSTLSPLRFRTVRMNPESDDLCLSNQILGGFYTSSLVDDPDGPLSAFAAVLRESVRVRNPKGLHSMMESSTWWMLSPDPAARLLVIASPQSFATIKGFYPWRGGEELDFAAVARDRFAGVHLTAAAVASRHQGLEVWRGAEQTVWLSWAFGGEPERLEPPAWLREARERERDILRGVAPECAGAPPPKPGAHRYWLGAQFAGQWFDARPLSARGRSAVREAFGCEDAGGLEGRKLGAWRTMLEDIVVAHNFAGPDGEPLALGASGAEWLPVALIYATHAAYTLGNRSNRRKRYL